MKQDPFLYELALLARETPIAKKTSAKVYQRQMQRLHTTAFRRAIRRLRASLESKSGW